MQEVWSRAAMGGGGDINLYKISKKQRQSFHVIKI
jgi:hypothetical protein